MPCAALSVAPAPRNRVEVVVEFPPAVLRPHKPRTLIVEVVKNRNRAAPQLLAIVQDLALKVLRHAVRVAEHLRRPARGRIGKCEVERAADELADPRVVRNILVRIVRFEAHLGHRPLHAPGFGSERVLFDGFPRQSSIEAGDVLHDSVGHRHVREGADHRCTVAWRSPLWEPTALLVCVEPTGNNKTRNLGEKERVERVARAEGIPEAVVRHERARMHAAIVIVRGVVDHVAVFIRLIEATRKAQGAIKSRVKHGEVPVGFIAELSRVHHVHPFEQGVPLLLGLCGDDLERRGDGQLAPHGHLRLLVRDERRSNAKGDVRCSSAVGETNHVTPRLLDILRRGLRFDANVVVVVPHVTIHAVAAASGRGAPFADSTHVGPAVVAL
mmetsp:Transcript_893/g.1694  ORF Transcript_893/g.1694 Transcript_893/m.1694 type:complete len:385 (+) Transcript_893:671-1825(+)